MDLATLQARLSEAESAYHALMTGAREAEVQGPEGMRVKYTEAKAGDLQAYIGDLKTQIVQAGGSVSGLRRRALIVDL